MPQIGETGPNATQMAGSLAAALEALDLNQTVTFQAYTRMTLPLDGYVFWVATGEFTPVKGSLHYSQEMVQNAEETYGMATVTFSTQHPLTLFSPTDAAGKPVAVDTLFVATVAGFRIAFSQQQGLYTQAGPLYHYFGHSVAPALSAQLIDRDNQIDLTQAVVNNSLPLWLMLNNFSSPFDDQFNTKGVPFYVAPPTLFPAGLVPANQLPPYGTVYIGEGEADTEALQQVPTIDVNRNHDQLCADWVTITLYGLQANACLDFQDTVNWYMELTDNFGLMNMPVFRDGIRTQVELQARAMKKVARYRVSYHQLRVANIARKLITSCVPTYLIRGA